MTPPPSVISQQLDDMRRLLGTVIGQNRDILDETAKRRSSDFGRSPRGSGMRRVEELLRRALRRSGDIEMADELDREREADGPPPDGYTDLETPSDEWDREGSYFPGSETMYTEELYPKARDPPNSFTSSYDRRRRGRFSKVPESLLDGDLPTPEFDEDFAMQDLPPQTPSEEYVIPRAHVPPHIANRPRRPSTEHGSPPPSEGEMYDEYTDDDGIGPPPPDDMSEERDERPLPYRPDERHDREPSEYTDDDAGQRTPHRLPPPQPVDLPTPVGSPGYLPQTGQTMRPPYGMGGRPPPPGFTDMPRPSMPRIAGVRDPISTT